MGSPKNRCQKFAESLRITTIIGLTRQAHKSRGRQCDHLIQKDKIRQSKPESPSPLKASSCRPPKNKASTHTHQHTEEPLPRDHPTLKNPNYHPTNESPSKQDPPLQTSYPPTCRQWVFPTTQTCDPLSTHSTGTNSSSPATTRCLRILTSGALIRTQSAS